MTTRTDAHAPSNIEPSDYTFVAVITHDRGGEDFSSYEREAFMAHMAETGAVYSRHEHGGTCHVCGANAIDYAIFFHAPTHSYIRTGLTCAEKIEAGHAEDFRHLGTARRKAAAHREKAAATVAFLETHELLGLAEALFNTGDIGGIAGFASDTDEMRLVGLDAAVASEAQEYRRNVESKVWAFIDLVRKHVKYGAWSEKQLAFAKRTAEYIQTYALTRAERLSAKAALPAAPEGDQLVVGAIVSLKTMETAFGSTLKMLVQADANYRVWSTVPASLDAAVRGSRVSFVATLTRSNDDHNFAFAKRPRKASVLAA